MREQRAMRLQRDMVRVKRDKKSKIRRERRKVRVKRNEKRHPGHRKRTTVHQRVLSLKWIVSDDIFRHLIVFISFARSGNRLPQTFGKVL